MKVPAAVKLRAVRPPGRLLKVRLAMFRREGVPRDGDWVKVRTKGSLKMIMSIGVKNRAVAVEHAKVAISMSANYSLFLLSLKRL